MTITIAKKIVTKEEDKLESSATNGNRLYPPKIMKNRTTSFE